MRPLRLTAVLLTIAVCGTSFAAEKPKFKIGALKAISKDLGKLVKLTLVDGGLVLDRAHWGPADAPPPNAAGAAAGARFVMRVGVGGANRSPATKAFREVQQAAGARGSRMSMSGTHTTMSFRAEKLDGKLELGGGSVRIELKGKTDVRCALEVLDEGGGAFRLILSNGEGRLLLINQTSGGKITVADMTGAKPVVKGADSFAALYRSDTDYVDNRLFPVLKHVGVKLFPDRFSPQVVNAVLAQLRSPARKDQAKFNALLKQLDDDDYDTRQAAIKALIDRYAEFARQIEKAAKRPASEEVKTNLEKVLARSAKNREVVDVVSGLKLTDDATYLAKLAQTFQGADRKGVEARVAELNAGAK
jgi:hypothetical protein